MNSQRRVESSTRRFRLTILLAAIGVALRLWQYLANNSLFVDEAALARNIIDRTPRALLYGLDYAQSGPVGFLLVEKAMISLFGTSEYALRAFPFACGLLALCLFWRIASLVLRGWWVTYAVGLFSLGIPFICFSSLVKQYSTDILLAVLLLLAAIEIRQRGMTWGRAGILAALGAASVWFSQPALFNLAGIGAGLVFLKWERPARWKVASVLLVWAISSVAAAAFALGNVTETDQAFFRWIWADGFMPWPPETASDAVWVLRKITFAFGRFGSGMGQMNGGLSYRWSFVFTLVMLTGLWSLWRTRRDVALLLLLPIIITAVASGVKLYPFTARLLAFALPGLLLATAAGAGYLANRLPKSVGFLAPVGLAILVGAPLYAAATNLPPFRLQHVRPLIQQIYAERKAGDALYVFYGGGQAFRYYATHLSLAMDDVRVGKCRPLSRDYLRDLDEFRGRKRLWVLVTSAFFNGVEESLILEYLDAIGRREKTLVIPGSEDFVFERASAYLYDLSDVERAASTTSSTFPVGPDRTIDPLRLFRCYGVSQIDPVRP